MTRYSQSISLHPESTGARVRLGPRHLSSGACAASDSGHKAWAEVLDCDAFQAFKETGNIFNQGVAERFRKFILTPGGIDKGTVMYQNFRGRQPKVDGLLENRGLK